MHRMIKTGLGVTVSLLIVLALLLAGPAYMLASQRIELGGVWSRADRSSAELAPAPRAHPQALVQVYAARAFDWRGAFGVHTWIATKPAGARHYQVHQVLGWRRPTVSSRPDVPDRAWYGSAPTLIAEVSGDAAARAIPEIRDAVAAYPATDRYRVWPGPNSNTFVAWVVRRVPELQVDFPPTAVGKDYLLDALVAEAPSGTGYQVSLGGGLFGLTVAYDEGVEWHLLGLTLGVDITRPALKLPGIGRLGMAALDTEGGR
ncbi:uncharacterized protein DUF3750 [Chromohalobacter marismortui]|uniref:Uncharacterized protein DUF3750 n=1 Tax=Chromohalobacter marismortui TaxID=42055 RepID=A0A4R7NJ22_9GAMM|nr:MULTISPECIES: DUF3750 domain-containing protein [Chromohalobacter]MCI0510828.1 DUF3750 domain-containing protein [Chromohalobacter sp.]MCI0592706.1 DUF3750 domain-containing protein [Chromohalobacter sp.]TDU20240.1 uncharacterized protein DUF3750 [Chromohalobacter marismortui]